MRVALRYDRSPAIGLGHARRAAALDAALAAHGVEVVHAVSRAARAEIVAEGVAPERTVDVNGAGAASLVESGEATHVVFDLLWSGNAAAAVREVAEVRRRGGATVVIDSMAPDHYPSVAAGAVPDLLVAPYLGARRAEVGRERLCGARYAILGAEFARSRPRPAARVPRRVLLSCGGSDVDGLAPAAARAAAAGGALVDVAIGPLFGAHAIEALEIESARDPRIRLHRAPRSLVGLIARADLVAGRPGLLRYEAAALKRPGVYLARGTAYRDYFEGFAAAGLATIHFESDPDGRATFLDELSTIGHRLPAACPTAMGSARVDAGGAERVAAAILATRVQKSPCR